MTERFWKILAISTLGILALREINALISPVPGLAQSNSAGNFFIEPGTVTIPVDGGGTIQGKVFINVTTGDTYGFPVFGPKLPYPGRQVSEDRPLTVNPVYLGKFNLQRISR